MKYAFGKTRIISNFLSGRRDFVLTEMKNTKLRKVIVDVGDKVATRHGSFNIIYQNVVNESSRITIHSRRFTDGRDKRIALQGKQKIVGVLTRHLH